jgi:hypothetical protein
LIASEQTTTPFNGKQHQSVATYLDLTITITFPIVTNKSPIPIIHFRVKKAGKYLIKFKLTRKRDLPNLILDSRGRVLKSKNRVTTTLLPIKNSFIRKPVGLTVEDFKFKLYKKMTFEQFEDDLTLLKLLTSQ